MFRRSLSMIQVVATEIAALLAKHAYREWTLKELKDKFPDRDINTIKKALQKIEKEKLASRGKYGWIRTARKGGTHHHAQK